VRYSYFPGTAVAQWLGCCATNRKVAGSIPAGVNWFFIGIKSFWDRLSLDQKCVPGVFPGCKGGRCVRLTTYHRPVPLSRNLGTLTYWNPLDLSRPVIGLLFFTLTFHKHEQSLPQIRTTKFHRTHKLIGELQKEGFCQKFVLFCPLSRLYNAVLFLRLN